MTLAPLADVGDLQAGLGITIANTPQAIVLLERASAIVRTYTGQQFVRLVDDKVLLRVNRGQVVLPQRPADKPTAISYADGTGLVPTAAWWWDGVDTIDLSPPPWVINAGSITHHRVRPVAVNVTYSHGSDDIPGDVISVVCSMVGRVVSMPGVMPGLKSGGIDDFTFALGGTLTTGATSLTLDEMKQLDRYKRRVRSVVFR